MVTIPCRRSRTTCRSCYGRSLGTAQDCHQTWDTRLTLRNEAHSTSNLLQLQRKTCQISDMKQRSMHEQTRNAGH